MYASQALDFTMINDVKIFHKYLTMIKISHKYAPIATNLIYSFSYRPSYRRKLAIPTKFFISKFNQRRPYDEYTAFYSY